MEEAGSRAASLLASLNLQRERSQFCDCVVRQKQNPGQLHPAHRCVLAASSPVLASILSSTGVLVELQAQCLSDTVLALLLDYIYTGALPCARSQHQYYSLLTAASYLQMDELQEALRAWQLSVDNMNVTTGAENQPHKDIKNTYATTVNKYLPSSLEREDHQYSASVDSCDDIDPCRSKSGNGANYCGRKDASTLSNLTPQDLSQNIPYSSKVHRVFGVDREVQKDQFHSAPSTGTEEELEKMVEGRMSSFLICTAAVQEEEMSRAKKKQRLCLTVKSKTEEKQTNRKEEDVTQIHRSPLLRLSTSQRKDNVSPSQCSSSSSSSSPHPCYEAVPVIRHSSGAAMLQLTDLSPMPPPYHPVPQASVSSSRAPDSRLGSAVEGITTRHKRHCGEQNQDYENNKDHTGTQSWDSDQSDILKQYCNSSSTDQHMSNVLCHITDPNDHHCHSFQSKSYTKHPRDDSLPQNKDRRNFHRGLQYKSDQSFDDIPSKHQRLDCHSQTEQPFTHSQDHRAVVQLPVPDSDTGSDSHCEKSLEGEEKKEDRCSRCPTETDNQDSHHEPKSNWYPSMHRAETSAEDAASSQNEHIADNKDTAMTDKRHSVFTAGLSGSECCSSVELETMSERHLTTTMPVDNNMSDPMYSAVGPSYHGRLQYHCLPQEEAYLSRRYSGRKHSHHDHSDQCSDEEEVGACYSPLRQHFATGTTDQVLLLDISAKPAELLVSDAFDQENTFQNVCGVREQWNKVTSIAGVETKYWVRETTNKTNERSVGKDPSRPGAEVIHKAGVVEGVSNPKDAEKQTTTMTVYSPPIVPDSVQASMSSTLSVCIPSAPSASMPTNISAHLLNPVHHPFQCSLCDRSFSQRGSLNRHVRSHLGVRPFPCPRCPMTFSRQYRVTEHMRVHQRYVLESDCPQPPASSI